MRPFGAWFDAQFPELRDIPIRVFCVGSIFAVHRRHIEQRPGGSPPTSLFSPAVAVRSAPAAVVARTRAPRAWRRCATTHSNPEVGHYLERSWGAVFYPYEPECVDGIAVG